ncbi:hypothetical protein RclHR1_04070001 [Rhizophagus clarus]|uniref:C2H2-type domain-containing protein n=1 Tax=Rhizophagus clarus TaxID=94130 RepID=A0A2Z6S9M3_9GLOM|nr:hypothetical protein RclHR1_04070001 [Rhizophagus clarus]
MSSIKCPFCLKIFFSRSGYTQHINYYLPSIVDSDDDELNFITDVNNISLNSEEFMHDIEKNMITFDDQNEEANKSFNQKFETEVNTSYPNETYADLMTLVTKYKLNNVTGNIIIKFFNKHANLNISPLSKSIEKGRKYMDNMNIPNLTYSKTCIIKYNNKDYYLHHRSLINYVKHILSTSDISEYFMQNFEMLKIDEERTYSEQNTGKWWENTEKSILDGKLLSIILYSNTTNVNTLEKSQLHPIYMLISNIKNWRQNKSDAKQLLGYLPILQANNNSEKNSANFKKAVHKAFHESLKVLLKPLLSNSTINLILNNEKI